MTCKLEEDIGWLNNDRRHGHTLFNNFAYRGFSQCCPLHDVPAQNSLQNQGRGLG